MAIPDLQSELKGKTNSPPSIVAEEQNKGAPAIGRMIHVGIAITTQPANSFSFTYRSWLKLFHKDGSEDVHTYYQGAEKKSL